MNNPNDTHEVRELKWKVKTLGKQLGRQGQTIHDLRNENVGLRAALVISPRGYQRNLERLRDAEAEVRVLQEKLNTREDRTVVRRVPRPDEADDVAVSSEQA